MEIQRARTGSSKNLARVSTPSLDHTQAQPACTAPPRRTNSTGSEERTCWICFAFEEDEPGKEWIFPCMCRGATKWVHQDCLQPWVDQKQQGSSSIQVKCPQCQHPYTILYPTYSPLLYIYECGNRAITYFSPVILTGLTAASFYWISFTYGVISVSVALGKMRSIEFFSRSESSLVVVTLPLIPMLILGFKLMRLEVVSIRLWYNVTMPFVNFLKKNFLRKFLHGTKSQASTSTVSQTQFIPHPINVFPFISRSIVSTFLLPAYASTIGWGLSFVLKSSSTFKRTILGALFYFLASYAIKIQLELYRGQFRVTSNRNNSQ